MHIPKWKRKRSDSVVWQKPLHPQTNPKCNVKTQKGHQKLRLGQSVGVMIATQLVCLRVFQRVWWSIWLRQILQAVLCPTQLFQWKLICTINQHCISYKISNRLQFNSSLFFWNFFETVLHWHNFFQDVPHIQKTFRYIYLLLAIIEGTLVIIY